MKEYSLEIGDLYSDVSDERLDNLILQKMKDFPNCGYRRMNGLLLADGLRVQERKSRKAMQRVDPECVPLRMIQLQLIHQRKYQYVYLKRRNKHLAMFIEGWDRHKISSCNSMTPNQLWIYGLHSIANSGSTIAQEIWEPLSDDEAASYGIDHEGPTADSQVAAAEVIVPDTECPLNEVQLAVLNQQVGLSEISENFGIDNYLKTKQIIEELLSN
eukprot:gene1750-1949_t